MAAQWLGELDPPLRDAASLPRSDVESPCARPTQHLQAPAIAGVAEEPVPQGAARFALRGAGEAGSAQECATDVQWSGHRPGGASYPLSRGLRRVLRDPAALRAVLNARWRLRGVARLPRSVRLTGRVRIDNPGRRGRIEFGERVNLIGRITPLEIAVRPGGCVTIGDGVFVNYGVSISAHAAVTIGADCQIGQYVIIQDNDYHDLIDKRALPPSRPVVIEDRVWIGARAIVLRGVRIGHDAVVGAGSVVTRDVPPWTVVAGVPARVVRTIDPAERSAR